MPKPLSKQVKVNLREDGVLWLINRVVFHPRGFALQYDPDTGEFHMIGDGKEPFIFKITTEDSLFESVERLFAITAYENRPDKDQE